MVIPGDETVLPDEPLKRANDVVERLGQVYAKSLAMFTAELMTIMEQRGMDISLAMPAKTKQEEDATSLLESAPEWVRRAYQSARDARDVEGSDERPTRGRLIRNRLALALVRRQMTQAALARQLGKSPSHISRVFRNPERCRLNTLQQIAETLNVDLSDIVGGFGSLK